MIPQSPPLSLPTDAKTEAAHRTALSRQSALHDAGLVRRFKAGDAGAFVEIMTRHRERMFSIAFGMLKNRADAEEIVQDTFIRAHRALASFRGDAALSTWLQHIAGNLARNRYWYFMRRRQNMTVSLSGTPGDSQQPGYLDLVATEAAGPVREAETSEFSALVTVCMGQLAARSREILTLHTALNQSYDQIARDLGLSLGTVKGRVRRARAHLRALMVKACPEFDVHGQPMVWFDAIRFASGAELISA